MLKYEFWSIRKSKISILDHEVLYKGGIIDLGVVHFLILNLRHPIWGSFYCVNKIIQSAWNSIIWGFLVSMNGCGDGIRIEPSYNNIWHFTCHSQKKNTFLKIVIPLLLVHFLPRKIFLRKIKRIWLEKSNFFPVNFVTADGEMILIPTLAGFTILHDATLINQNLVVSEL